MGICSTAIKVPSSWTIGSANVSVGENDITVGGSAPPAPVGPYGQNVLAENPDTLQRPPIPTFVINEAVEPYPVETQGAYNTRVGASIDNVSTVGPYGSTLLARDPVSGMRPPVPIPPVPGHQSLFQYDVATGRLPLPGETQAAYNTRVGTVPPIT